MPESSQRMQLAYLLCIDLPYACFGAIVDIKSDRCVRVAPIGGWMLGMTSEKISQWASKKKALLTVQDTYSPRRGETAMSKPIVLILLPLFAGVFVLGGGGVFVATLIVFGFFVLGFDLLGRVMCGPRR